MLIRITILGFSALGEIGVSGFFALMPNDIFSRCPRLGKVDGRSKDGCTFGADVSGLVGSTEGAGGERSGDLIGNLFNDNDNCFVRDLIGDLLLDKDDCFAGDLTTSFMGDTWLLLAGVRGLRIIVAQRSLFDLCLSANFTADACFKLSVF